MKTTLLVPLLLVGAAVAFVPAANADTCASRVLQDQVCAPYYVAFCTVQGALAKDLRDAEACDLAAVARAIPPLAAQRASCTAADPTVDFLVCVYVPYCTGGSIKDEGARLSACVAYVLP